jgi:predicted RNase H-like HicB family nuclease
MTDLSKQTIHYGPRDGKWIAATGSSPYFCVEAETKEAVLLLAREAAAFYGGILNENGGNPPTPMPFVGKITVCELAA